MMFIGDEVKVVTLNSDSHIKVGEVGIITEITDHLNWNIGVTFPSYSTITEFEWLDEDELELVTKGEDL